MSTKECVFVGGKLTIGLFLTVNWLGWTSSVQAQPTEAVVPDFEQARILEEAGKEHEAFLKYLEKPGGENAAAALGRTKPREYLLLLKEQTKNIPEARRKLIEGDLQLTLRNRTKALECYREVVKRIAVKQGDGWDQGWIPRGDYIVEQSQPPHEDYGDPRRLGPSIPFTLGPGSHRDNWLLRRFIALEAWPEARQEFERVWQLHREATRPHVISQTVIEWESAPPAKPLGENNATNVDTQKPNVPQPKSEKIVKSLVTPVGFNSLGLRFALDYAFFLTRQQDAEAARIILQEPFLLIDLDRNPAFPNVEPIAKEAPVTLPERIIPISRFTGFGYGQEGGSSGVSRKEYIRLVYGEFKSASVEMALVNTLEVRIKRGENRLRRVLAQIRSHQNQPEDALALELEYIQAAKFDRLTTQYRRGLILDAAGKIPEAVAALEQALALPFTPPNLPDSDEDAFAPHAIHQFRVAPAARRPGSSNTAGLNSFRSDVTNRLLRLYASQGATEKVLAMTLHQCESSPNLLASLEALEAVSENFRTHGQVDRFTDWAKNQLSQATEPQIRVALQWLLGNRDAALESLAGDKTLLNRADWKNRIRTTAPEKWPGYLKRIVAAFPEDTESLLELLELEQRLDGPESIQILEQLLNGRTAPAFARYKGAHNRTQFRNYYDLAYRLMRGYERLDQPEKLHSLGLRIARGDKPFPEFDRSNDRHRDRNGLIEDANACLALAVQRASGREQLLELKAALVDSRWQGVDAQIERRLAAEMVNPVEPLNPSLADRPTRSFGWANLPEGVRVIASNENVLALANDDKYVYAGHPWGVAVYDLQGQPVTRLALDESASSLVCLSGMVWVGSAKGLYRITPGTWAIAHQWLHGDVSENRRHSHSFPGSHSYVFDNSVYTLAADGDLLWIGLHRNIQVLNTKTLELRPYSLEELHLESWAGFERIVPDGRYVWADCRSGLRRYDRTTDQWSTFEKPLVPEHVRFLDIIDGHVCANVHLNDILGIRTCRINRDTLAVTPLSLAPQKSGYQANSPMRYFGKWKGKLVFGPDRPMFVFDDEAGELKPISAFDAALAQILTAEKRPPDCDGRLRPAVVANEKMTEFEHLFGKPDFGDWHVIALPEAHRNQKEAGQITQVNKSRHTVRILGDRNGRRLTQNSYEDWPDQYRDLDEQEGGLFLVSGADLPQRISAWPYTDALGTDYAHQILFAGEQAWICTSLGLTKLDAMDQATAQYTRADGLCANGILAGAELDGKLYFATGWGDSGGGLMVFDPQTLVFTSFHQADGLDTDKLESVTVENGQLKLNYAVEYLRGRSQGNFSYQQFPPGFFDPKTNRFISGGEAHLLRQNEAEFEPKQKPRAPLPFLGGFVNQRVTRNGKTYLCGTRGVVILDATGEVKMKQFTIPPLSARLIEGEHAKWLAEVERRKPMIKDEVALTAALQDPNPYYRAQAMASTFTTPMKASYLPLIASQLDDPNSRVRSTAAFLVTQFQDQEREQVRQLLRKMLKDRDSHIRAAATIELARRGELPGIPWIKEILLTPNGFGNFPFGAISSIGSRTDRESFYEAIAPMATPEIFALLLESPPHLQDYDHETKVFPQLGRALLQHPKIADMLLRVHDAELHDTSRREFARQVFRFAGVKMLTILHQALASEDRVIRSNAARACGSIGDPSSVPPLITALDLESGLSRASIVWALGELRAQAALPIFAQLYVDAQLDEKRHAGSGFRQSQQAAVLNSQFDTLKNVDAIGAEWDELKSRTLEPILDPARQEELLRPRHILDAIGKIGAAESQEFYRTLAGNKDLEARREAAEHLANGTAADRPRNVTILKNLLTDADIAVRLRAGASLLILEVPEGQAVLNLGLNSSEQQDLTLTLRQLSRIKASGKLQFARQRLAAIAGNRLFGDGTRDMARSLLERLK